MDFNKVAKKIVGYVNESVASGKGSVNVIYNSVTLGKTISLVAESKQDKAFVEFKPTRSPADYSLKISLAEGTTTEAIEEAIVKGMKDHVIKEAWYDDDEELEAAEKKKEKEEFGADVEDDVDPEDVEVYDDDFGAKKGHKEFDESADDEEPDNDEDDKYADILKNKGRIGKVANRPAKFGKDMLGEESDAEEENDEDEDDKSDLLKNKARIGKVEGRPAKFNKNMMGEAAVKTDLSGNKSTLGNKAGMKSSPIKKPANPKVPTDGNLETMEQAKTAMKKTKSEKSPIKDKTPAAKVPKDGNLQDMKKAKAAMSKSALAKSVPAKTGHDLLTSMANTLMYDQTMKEYWCEEAGVPDTRTLVDGAAGIYVPKRFVTNYEATEWGVSPEDAAVLAAGPDAEDYWEVWDEVLQTARYTDKDGKVWSLSQDSDLFAVNMDSIEGEGEEEELDKEDDDTRHYI